MPWSNQGGGGGGWKGGNGGPWGQGPSGGQQQPDFEEILKRGQDRLKRAMPGGGMNRGLALLVAAAGLAAAAFVGLTARVNPNQVGVVTRFGEYQRDMQPGLNFRLPYPIEEVYLVNYTAIQRIIIGGGSRTTSSGVSVADDESLMLTGDGNLVNIDFFVNWRILDPKSFLFNIELPEKTVGDVAESAMREVVGRSDSRTILSQEATAQNWRGPAQDNVKQVMQTTLDSYGAGVIITDVQLQRVAAPQDVIDAFNEVTTAGNESRKVQNEAQSYRNKVVPEARGEAKRIVEESEGYRQRVIAEAEGQADRFVDIYEEYKKAPDVTRQRMFLETMERVLGDMDKVIIDQKEGSGSGVVPVLPLNDLVRRPANPPAP